MKASKRVVVFSILSLVVVLIAITGFTYAFFTVNITSNNGNNNIAVNAHIGNCEDPMFTSYTSGDLILDVTDADMLDSPVSASTTHVVAEQDQQSLYVQFIGATADNNGNCTGSITCSYDLVWHNLGDSFPSAPNAVSGNLTEYELAITGSLRTTKNIATLTNNSVILHDSVTSTGSLATKTYNITAAVYNWNFAQLFQNSHFEHNITVENIVCN